MNVILIDYCDPCFSREAKTPAPAGSSGKFVQLRNKTTEYLVFAPKELASYHADIAERFCKEKELRGCRDGEGKRFDIHEPTWVIVGGGKFELDRRKKYIRLYGNSLVYGRFDSKGLKGKILSIGELSDYTADIE